MEKSRFSEISITLKCDLAIAEGESPSAYFEGMCLRVIPWIREELDECQPQCVTITFSDFASSNLSAALFESICNRFQDALGETRKLQIALRTNAALFSEEWMCTIAKFRISVQVEFGKFTQSASEFGGSSQIFSDEICAGVHLLHHAAKHDLMYPPTALITLGLPIDGTLLYQRLVDELGFTNLHFSLPRKTADQVQKNEVELVRDQLGKIFNRWKKDNNPGISIQLFDQFFRSVFEGVGSDLSARETHSEIASVCVSSNGDISLVNPAGAFISGRQLGNIAQVSLREFLRLTVHKHLREIEETNFIDCRNCAWVGICQSGSLNSMLINRFTHATGFDNKSIFCEALDDVYQNLAQSLLVSGMNSSSLIHSLEKLRDSRKFGATPKFALDER